ncbi:FAD binding domain-containing protein [Adhaeribacter radiodurans]|uniref:Xanthine dehydrogenase family protein subunit M n=1 Tax=Adhaeribacter radiodurans TaxID=2745197 RepID=A0A7L7LA67_9BACT|nr:xanthine dehydrogenase family protein subunit M [Adhaeribacter radiodurans]QMU29299.1 xanthine dehydrogenase family protein subunit M [Adhaeribacter radiodurans]
MIPAAFEYKKVHTIEDAIASLGQEESKLLAGGYSLIPSMKLRLNQPSLLIDIGDIPDLKGIREEDGEIVINAGTTHHDILFSDLIENKLPFFHQAASMIGDEQVRNRGTIGGSLAHADPAADWPALVLAADATIEVVGSEGKRSLKATEFFTGLFSTALQENEIITAIRIPIPAEGFKSIYLKFENPASRFAIVGCAVLRYADRKTNIAFTGVADFAFRDAGAEQVISGKIIDDATIKEAVNAALTGANILSDNFASEEYRKHLAGVYLKRALQEVA